MRPKQTVTGFPTYFLFATEARNILSITLLSNKCKNYPGVKFFMKCQIVCLYRDIKQMGILTVELSLITVFTVMITTALPDDFLKNQPKPYDVQLHFFNLVIYLHTKLCHSSTIYL